MNVFSMGCAVGWYSPAKVIYTKNTDTLFSSDELLWISVSLPLCVAISMPMFAFLIPKIGNRITLLAITPILAASWFLLLSTNVICIILGRCLIGVCGGIGGVAAPLYIGEIAEARIRGRISIIFQIMLCGGVLFITLFGIEENHYCLVISSSIVSLLSLGLIWMKESPVYYLKREQMDLARESLIFYRGKGYDIQPELEKLEEYLDSFKVGETTCVLIKKKESKRALLICVGCHVFQQCSGIKSMIFYSHDIFSLVYGHNTHESSIIILVILVATTLLSAYLVETAGRKLLLLISFSLMALCHAGLAAFFFTKKYSYVSPYANYLPVILCSLYILGYSLGAGPVSWAFQAELFPAKVKYAIGSFSAGTNWMAAFIMLILFPTINEHFGMEYAFIMFGSICVISIFFTIFVVIETKGKNLEEVQELLGKKR